MFMIGMKYKFKVCSFTVNKSKRSNYLARADCESFTRVRHFGISNLVMCSESVWYGVLCLFMCVSVRFSVLWVACCTSCDRW